MPQYLFKDTKTDKEWKEWMGISEADAYLLANPHIERMVFGAPRISTGVNQFGHKKKPDDGFRDILREIKKKNPRNTIDTY